MVMRYQAKSSGVFCRTDRYLGRWRVPAALAIMRPDLSQAGASLQSSLPVRYRGNRNRAAIALLLTVVLSGCTAERQEVAAVHWQCDPDARLSTRLFGAVDVHLDWSAGELSCDGMPRPDGDGARLRLSGPASDAPDANTIAFIFGIPALEIGETATELGTNVTFMEEGSGRFFGTRDTEGCWTDIDLHDEVPGAVGSTYRIGGTVYCVSPLAELNGGSSIRFSELEFVARVNWDEPQ